MDVIRAGLAGFGQGGPVAPGSAGAPGRSGVAGAGTGPARPGGAAGGFGDVLAEKVRRQAGVRFSRHAEERLRAGGRTLAAAELMRLAEAVDRAAAKGSREALVVTGDLALVVDVRDRTVVTVVEAARMRDHVFTHIDSAVLL